MLLVFEGYFDEGRFVTDTPYIPEGKKTIVTVLDEAVDNNKKQSVHQKLWEGIIHEVRTSDEVLEGEPERLRFRTPQETENL